MKIYAFSGLGADGRIFKHLNIEHEISVVEWITPDEKECLASYAQRLGEQIDTTEPFVLLGVSFGGMLVAELAQKLTPVKSILISSAVCYNNLPFLAGVSKKLKLHDLIPARAFKPPIWVVYLGFPFNREQRAIAKGIIEDADYHFTKWALGAIVNWENENVPENLIHFHGRWDPILPLKKGMNTEVLGKGHFIVLRKAEELSQRINEILS